MEIKYSLNSIAGYENEKKEVEKLINIINSYDKLKELGISIPKGLLLSGSPGVGKTLVAKVIAAETNVKMYQYDGALVDDADMKIKKIHDVYEVARQTIPSIVFIDEVDNLVTSRRYVSDSTRNTLKALLSEIDGINNSEGILTIATTNFLNDIPSALMRSGRMDKHIAFSLPTLKSREAIIKYYIEDKPMIKDINIKSIAKKTRGFSCADIKTLVNETMIEAISINKDLVTTDDFVKCIPLISIKGIRNEEKSKPTDRVCYHELGHFLMSYMLTGSIPDISCEKIGDVEGYARVNEEDDDSEEYTIKEMRNIALISIGGYAAEKYFLGNTSLGVCDDLSRFDDCVIRMAESGMIGSEYMFNANSAAYKYKEMGNNKPVTPHPDDARVIYFNKYLNEATEMIEENKGLLEYLKGKLQAEIYLDSDDMARYMKEYEMTTNIKTNIEHSCDSTLVRA